MNGEDVTSEGARIFAPLYGLPSWHVEQGHGSFITLEFGAPHLQIGQIASRPFSFVDGEQTRFSGRLAYVHGDWHLWIYMCHWSISVEEQHLAHSESDRVTIARALSVLNGQSIASYEAVGGSDARWRFAFDLGCNVDVWPYEDDDPEPAELWMLYEPTGTVVSMYATGELRRVSAQESFDQRSQNGPRR